MNCQIGIDLCSHRIGRYLLFIICLCAPHSKAACVHCVSCHWCCYWFCSILGSVQCINMRIYMKTTALMMSLLSTISRWTVLLVWQQQLCRFANRTNSTLIWLDLNEFSSWYDVNWGYFYLLFRIAFSLQNFHIYRLLSFTAKSKLNWKSNRSLGTKFKHFLRYGACTCASSTQCIRWI